MTPQVLRLAVLSFFVVGAPAVGCTSATPDHATNRDAAVEDAGEPSPTNDASARSDANVDAGEGGAPTAATETYVTDGFAPVAIAVGSEQVFWADSAEKKIFSCPLTGCGGAPEVVATNQVVWPRGLVHRDGALYWVTANALLTCSATGCGDAPSNLATGLRGSRVLAVDDVGVAAPNAYFTEWGADAISRCPLSGCGASPLPVVASGEHEVRGLIVHGSSLYWTTYGDLPPAPPAMLVSHVATCSVSGCPNPMVLSGDNQSPGAVGLATDGNTIHWAQATGIQSCPLTGCTGSPEVRSTSHATQLTLVGGAYYFLQIGGVMRCTSSTCANDLTKLADAKMPSDLVVDGEWVYWVQSSQPNDGIVARTKR